MAAADLHKSSHEGNFFSTGQGPGHAPAPSRKIGIFDPGKIGIFHPGIFEVSKRPEFHDVIKNKFWDMPCTVEYCRKYLINDTVEFLKP